MQKHYGTVFKSGNSFAIRVPMSYAEAQQLQEGQKIVLPRSLKSADEDDTNYTTPHRPDPSDPMPEWD